LLEEERNFIVGTSELDKLERMEEKLESLLKNTRKLKEAKLIEVYTEKSKEDKVCAICKDKSKTHAFLCGHVCVCEECASDLTQCPLCRKKGKAFRVFI
jgi:hypothetical protein